MLMRVGAQRRQRRHLARHALRHRGEQRRDDDEQDRQQQRRLDQHLLLRRAAREEDVAGRRDRDFEPEVVDGGDHRRLEQREPARTAATRDGASRQPTPMPRNDASRMKLEKYDSSRTCAGIQRMSATSRNRTRNDARKTLDRRGSTDISCLGARVDAELLQRFVRASLPLRDHDVAHVLQVGHAHLAREEARRR